MNSLDELTKALAQLEVIVPEVLEYRIHYDAAGNITQCTMQQHPLDTNYIVVTQEEYENYFRYTVVDNKLKKIDINTGDSVQLVKSTTGYAVVKNHAGILIEPTETYTDIEYYDRVY